MVESNLELDLMFSALSDSTRRGILELVAKTSLSIGEIATHFELTFGAISKHIKVLEKAKLISKSRRGKEQVVQVIPEALETVRQQIERYESIQKARFDAMERLMQQDI